MQRGWIVEIGMNGHEERREKRLALTMESADGVKRVTGGRKMLVLGYTTDQ